MIEKIKDFQEVEYHKSVAEMQRISYNKDCEDFELLSSSILIVFDFKEKNSNEIMKKKVPIFEDINELKK